MRSRVHEFIIQLLKTLRNPFLLLFAFSTFYVWLLTHVSFGQAEDPVFHDGFLIFRNFFKSPPGMNSLAQQKWNSIPYGFFGFLTTIVSVDTVFQYRVQLLLHVFIILIAIYVAIRQVARPSISLITTLAVFPTQAINEQLIYSIGPSQLVLVAFAIWSCNQAIHVGLKKFVFISIAVLAFSLPLVSNVPQLSATYFCVGTLFVLRIIFVRDKKTLYLSRFATFAGLTAVFYCYPLIIWLKSFFTYFVLSSFSVDDRFGNQNIITVIQGHGKWSIDDRNWLVDKYIQFLSPERQMMRMFFAGCVFLVIYVRMFRSFRNAKLASLYQLILTVPLMAYFLDAVFRDLSLKSLLVLSLIFVAGIEILAPKVSWRPEQLIDTLARITSRFVPRDDLFLVIASAAVIFLVLATMGNWDFFWNLRNEVSLLTMFREPWAKFSMPSILLIYLCGANLYEHISSSWFKSREKIEKRMFLFAIFGVAYLLVPVLLPGEVYQVTDHGKVAISRPTISDWRIAQLDVISLEKSIGSDANICIQSAKGASPPTYLLWSRFYNNQIIMDPADNELIKERCNEDKIFMILVLMDWHGDVSSTSFDKHCLDFIYKTFLVFKPSCSLINNSDYQILSIG